MKLVSETSEEDRARVAAEQAQSVARWHFERALRAMTGNLIRVTRGAGDGYKVGQQAQDLIEATRMYREAFGHGPSDSTYREALRSPDEEYDGTYGQRQWRQDALDQIVKGSLQVAASRMLGQKLQVSAGEREMGDGLRYYVEWLEEGRRERVAVARASRPPAAKKKKPAPRKK